MRYRIYKKYCMRLHATFLGKWIGGSLTNFHKVKNKWKQRSINQASLMRDRSMDLMAIPLSQKLSPRRFPIGVVFSGLDNVKAPLALNEARHLGYPIAAFIDGDFHLRLNAPVAYPLTLSNKSLTAVLFLYKLVLVSIIRGVLRRRLFLAKLGSFKFRKKIKRLPSKRRGT